MAGLSRGVVRTVLYLSSLARKPGDWVRISHRRLAEITGYAIDTVRRYIALAERVGLLRRRYRWGEDGEQRCNEYQLQMVENGKAPTDATNDAPPPKAKAKLRETIVQLAQQWVTAFNDEHDDRPFADVRAALLNPAERLFIGTDARGNGVHEACDAYVVRMVRASNAFRGARPRAIYREISRICDG